jgi:hypothetical protein
MKNISDNLNEMTEVLLQTAKQEQEREPVKRKDPNAPKHPPSSYLLYMLSIKDDVEKENPDSSFADKSKIYGANWKKLPEQEKEVKYISVCILKPELTFVLRVFFFSGFYSKG